MNACNLLRLLPLLFVVGSSTAPRVEEPGSSTTGRFLYRSVAVKGVLRRYAVWLPPGRAASPARPAVLFLHGSGECGDDGVRPTQIGLGPALQEHPDRWPCVVVFPQKPNDSEEWEEREDIVFAVLKAAGREFAIDPQRVALSGMSQGGHGAWLLGARHPGRWSCLVPVCGYGHALTISRRVARLPVWAFQGAKDDIVNPEDPRRIIEAIRAERARRGLDLDSVRFTLYPEANHNSWDAAFSDSELPLWMLRQRRAD
jgi:predicted peptidase